MPPKVKFTKENIISSALELVRAEGGDALNARALANKMGISTQPIFSSFINMEELRNAVLGEAEALYLEKIASVVKSGNYPPYKASGMGYIEFALTERELFKLLFMRDRSCEVVGSTVEFELIVQAIMKSLGLSRERAEQFHLEMWIFVHGIATMVATSYLDFNISLISTMLTDMYMGLKTRFLSENDE